MEEDGLFLAAGKSPNPDSKKKISLAKWFLLKFSKSTEPEAVSEYGQFQSKQLKYDEHIHILKLDFIMRCVRQL